MKARTGDQQLRSVSRSHPVTLQALNQNPLHEEEGTWMQAPIEVSPRGVGEVFSLDILSHRVSAMVSRVENRRSGFSLPVAVGVLSHDPPQSGLA
jgi:hypothetical protein